MISLANGNSDVLSNATVDLVGTEIESKEEHDEILSKRERDEKVWFHIAPKASITNSDSSEATEEVTSEIAKQATVKVDTHVPRSDNSQDIVENAIDKMNNCSNTSSSSSSVYSQIVVNGDKSQACDVPDITPTSAAIVSSVGNMLYLGNLKNIVKGDNQRKLYLVNTNLLKGGSVEMPVEQHVNDVIRKIKAVSSNSDTTTIESATTVPSFVQLSQSNMKNISKNITLHVKSTTTNPTNSVILKPNEQSYEILRSKLMENRTENSEPASTEIPEVPLKTKVNVTTPNNEPVPAYISKSALESSAVTEARNEFIRCRRKLIEAAIFPKLTQKVPLAGYVGPTFSCEECEDTFVTEESLKGHKDRRSVLFTYACPSCKQTLEFYNRCMFLLHVRSHDSSVKACFLTISTIPLNKLKFRVLSEDEEFSTGAEERVSVQSRASVVPSVSASATQKLVIKSVEKSDDFPAVRIVKSLKKKKNVSNTTVDENGSDDSFKQEPSSKQETSSLKALLVGESGELLNTKSSEKSSKSDDITQPVPQIAKFPTQKRKSLDNNKKMVNQSVSSLSLERPASSSSKVTVIDRKRETTIRTAVVGANVEEITLTSSDEEEESLSNARDKSKLVTCRECKKDVLDLTHHYRGDNRPKKEYPCAQCKFFNSTPCALSAHIRMHTKTQPYVCPDCGYFFSTLETFLVHVKQVCFYDFKNIRFKCPECSILKPSGPKFAEHLEREHTREVFKCDACMTSSYSSAVVEAHIKKMHPSSENITILEGYWCKFCPNMLVSKPLISHHINKHVYSLQHLRYVYICKECKNYASNRRLKFSDHYHNVCSQSAEASTKPRARKANRTRKRTETSDENHELSKIETEIGEKDSLLVTENWESDKTKTQLEANENASICAVCRKTKVDEHASLFCHQCVSFVDAEDAGTLSETVISEGNNRCKRKFKCKLCKQNMNRDWPTITKHFENNHNSDFDLRTRMRSSSIDSSSTPSNRKRKLIPKAKENAKILKTDSKYKCAKCSTIVDSRKQFHEHIVSHKSPSDFQCLECGLCFIVRQSLEKHLIVEHKIRPGNLKEYFKENGMAVSEEKVEERTLVENQCEVCKLECGTKQNYDKHIRTHGMAFVAMQSKAKT